jgi:hypothetical protein
MTLLVGALEDCIEAIECLLVPLIYVLLLASEDSLLRLKALDIAVANELNLFYFRDQLVVLRGQLRML